MKRFLTSILLIITSSIFAVFIKINDSSNTILEVFSPTKIGVDFDKNKTIETNEIICIEGIEAFSLNPSDNFVNQTSKSLNLTNKDIISLGFLAQDFAQKALYNQKVNLDFTQKVTSECKYANIKLKDTNYKDVLFNSGYGLVNGELGNSEKFKQNLAEARKLNLVILNHHSGKYHTLDCPYGNVAHDKVLIPEKQLPANSKPCKFCHKQENLNKNNYKKDFNIYNIPQIPSPQLKVTDGNIKVLYTDFSKNLKPSTDCSTEVCKEFVKLINETQETIDIAIYGYSEIPEITKALQKAKNRGVKLRFIYDENFDTSKNFYKDNKQIINLSEKAISDRTNIKSQSNMLMHNKFIIFDKAKIFTGSMNISSTGVSGYDVNDIVVINSKEIANLYSAEFEQMLNGHFHTKKVKLNMNNHFKLGDNEVEIYFSPKDKPSNRIISLINNAKSYIYLPTFLITHKDITNALIQAKKRGVDVRLIIDANSTTTQNSTHSTLRNNDILLKTENFAGKLHSKTIIIDDEYLITGSMNFSNSGENKNDENLLIIKSPKIAKAHKDFFLYLWTLIPNKYLKYNAKPEGRDSIGSCSDGIDNNFNGKIDHFDSNCK